MATIGLDRLYYAKSPKMKTARKPMRPLFRWLKR